MVPSVKQLFSFIKTEGYVSNSDVLGTYFNKDDTRFSVMKHGSWFLCYHNVKSNEQWQLIDKSTTLDSFQKALYWVVEQIQKQK